MRNVVVLSLLAVFYLTGCTGDDNYTPKRTGYFRIALPDRQYTSYFKPQYPFTFEYPVYASVRVDSTSGKQPYWLNVIFPRFKCNVYISYLTVDTNLSSYVEECRKFVVEHEVKASAIDEQQVANTKDKIFGTIYNIEGNAASNMQFYLTDSTHNFVRGALYFYAVPNKDSLQPVLNFVKQDIQHLIETFRWKTPEVITPLKP